MKIWMGQTTYMPQLTEDQATAGVYAFCDMTPAFDLRLSVDTGCKHLAHTLLADLRPFCEDETCRCSLTVVRRH